MVLGSIVPGHGTTTSQLIGYPNEDNVKFHEDILMSSEMRSCLAFMTFHTPSFGDEEFDIPAINPQQGGQQQGQQGHQGHHDQQSHYQPPMQGMQQMNQQMSQQQEALGMHDPTGGYQQPLYLSGPPGDHGMHGHNNK
nr:unnamed protein product [Callosobruchus chinensis]